jgi:hypothetical protein
MASSARVRPFVTLAERIRKVARLKRPSMFRRVAWPTTSQIRRRSGATSLGIGPHMMRPKSSASVAPRKAVARQALIHDDRE